MGFNWGSKQGGNVPYRRNKFGPDRQSGPLGLDKGLEAHIKGAGCPKCFVEIIGAGAPILGLSDGLKMGCSARSNATPSGLRGDISNHSLSCVSLEVPDGR